MATYTAQSDTYAGWNGAGRYFSYAALVAGALALLGWAGIHGHLHGVQPTAASDQLFLMAMTWIGGWLFVLMGIATLGSIMISKKSRGTVAITDEGVLRQIGTRKQLLEWREIEGFVSMPTGGVILVPHKGNRRIQIPNSLDDYRGCIAELKSRNIERLPSSRLRQMPSWKQRIWIGLVGIALGMAMVTVDNATHPHAAPRLGLAEIMDLVSGLTIGWCLWTLIQQRLEKSSWLRWINRLLLAGAVVWILLHISHTW